MKRYREILDLFLDFLKFGCFTFGGGWSIIAQMKKRYVEERKIITATELLDITSVARSLPGQMVANVAVLYGYKIHGFWGGVVSVLGLVLPPFIILIAITFFYSIFQNNHWVSSAMNGVRCAVAPICFSAVYDLLSSAYAFPPMVLVSVATFILYFFFNVNCVWLIIFGAICGLLISDIYERRAKCDSY